MKSGTPDYIGRYEILSRLGRGGMGVVYLARDPDIGRQVAIKFLLAEDDQELRERFLREARATGRLNHPNIVSIYDVGEYEGRPFLVMEFVDGHTLSDELRRTPPKPLVRRLEIIEQVANALDFAHGFGLVHRDVKPSNVMIDRDGTPHLLDFGIAHVVSATQTGPGFLLGTVQYMSPEQVRGRPVDRRSDVFSLGLLLYEVVSGKPAFGMAVSTDVVNAILAIAELEPTPLRDLFTNLDPDLDGIVTKSLQKDPDLRYQRASEMGAAVLALRRRLEASFGDSYALVPVSGSSAAEASEKAFEQSTKNEALSTLVTPPRAPVRDGTRLTAAEPEALWRRAWQAVRNRIATTFGSPSPATRAPMDSAPDVTVAPPSTVIRPRPRPPAAPRPPDRPAASNPNDASAVAELVDPFDVPGPAEPKGPGSRPRPESNPPPDSLSLGPTVGADLRSEQTVLVAPFELGVKEAPGADESMPAAASDATVFLGPDSATEQERPAARLLVVRSPDARRSGNVVDLWVTPFTIGRGADASLILDDTGLSRQHAVIDYEHGGYVIRDQGSANGIYVNGRLVRGVQALFFGASIALGRSVLSFSYGGDLTLPDLTGATIADRYVLRRMIRESVKAAMYVASDQHVPREVAIKLLSPTLMQMSGYREQFAREAAMASHLQHPHICRLLDSGLTDVTMGAGPASKTHFLCFELMAGGNLSDRLETIADIGLQEICQWVDSLGDALHYAHDRGIIHGDLKPSSIVFDLAGHPYLTDFAIAQRALSAEGQYFTGSPAYVAPEQWDNGTVTPGTDQFAFAVIAYYLIAGSKPYEGLDHPDIRAQQFRRGPEPAHEVAARNKRPPVQRVVSDVLRRGLATIGSDRYATTEQFARALTKGLAEGRQAGGVSQVFISYDREQSGGWARYFADKLKDRYGFRVFMDTVGLDRAGRFSPRLVKAIEDCDVFVCFLAGSTLESKWVNEEIRVAHERAKLMIPIFQEAYVEAETASDNGALEALLSHQGVKLFDISGHYVDAAVADLAAMIKSTTA